MTFTRHYVMPQCTPTRVAVLSGRYPVRFGGNWPAKIKPRREDTPVHIVDWFPTLATVANAKAPDNLDGRDLGPLLMEGEPLAARDLHWIRRQPPNRWAITDGRWKLVRYGETPPSKPSDWQLFDLQTDPAEKTDLAKTNPDRLKALHQRYLKDRKKNAAR